MSQRDIESAIYGYARKHGFLSRRVRYDALLRFVALRAWKAEQAFRSAQHVEA